MKQHTVQVGDINPKSAALTALAKRMVVSFENNHLNVAARAIHGFLSCSFGGVLKWYGCGKHNCNLPFAYTR